MSFDIKVHAILKFGDIEIWITDTTIGTWIIMGVLILFAIAVRIHLRNFKDVPRGFQNAVEYIVEMYNNFLVSTAGERFKYLGPWFFTVFAFILLSNLSGLFFLRNPTADWATTLAMALVTFTLIQVCGTIHKGPRYWKFLIEPYPVFLPLNIIGELARPVSLSFRLFGNVLSGMILLGLVYGLAPIVARFVLPAVLHAFFDVAIGAIQTYVFCTLSLSFISQAATPDEA